MAEGLSRQAARDGCTIRTIVEMDTGLGRCGTQSPRATLELARHIDGLPGLEFGGVMLYPSKEEARPFLDEVRDLTSRAGLPLAVVSGGGTGDEEVSKSLGCTETRIGSYAYEGMTRIRERDDLHPDRCSLRLAVTVVSANRPGAVIVDAGQKAFNNFPPLALRLLPGAPRDLDRSHVRGALGGQREPVHPHLRGGRSPLLHSPARRHDHQSARPPPRGA